MIKRRRTRQVRVGGVAVGGDAPISVQSMTNTDTSDVGATVAQIKALEGVGCEIVRVAVPNTEAAGALGRIREAVDIPLIADIHFDYRLALMAIDAGVDGLRLNPGNIGSIERVREVASAASGGSIPIRIGVNAGSLEKDILARYGHPTPEALKDSALGHIRILEGMGRGYDAEFLRAAYAGARMARLDRADQACVACENLWGAWFEVLLPDTPVTVRYPMRQGKGDRHCHFIISVA